MECTRWKILFYFQLKDVVQQSDERFAATLTKIGNGRGLAQYKVSYLESRSVTTEKAAKRCPSGVPLEHKGAEAFDIATAEACTEYAIHCLAVDTICGHSFDEEYAHAEARVATMSKVEMANLTHKVLLCLGKPYMVIRNIDVTDSPANGSVGILKPVRRDTGQKSAALLIEFTSGVGVAALPKGRS
ncbi:hypothetical protein IscW_ISCW003843 [Ixodes scapularis]|uniref:Uncharacterized protein n=1 Tax=Ixodes scapularis TaxID=6945 RepID=B7PGE6_IXOSC|nr:hypothetical protein IscW_ISCW003843 [Ixodes scapularis]|eukprot:XP_002434268.1 hypothetical protein IscW_ISCW003843 [Ixodes scapularis]